MIGREMYKSGPGADSSGASHRVVCANTRLPLVHVSSSSLLPCQDEKLVGQICLDTEIALTL